MLACFTIAFCMACNEQAQQVVLYRNTGKVDRAYDATENTFWDFKEYDNFPLKP